VLAREALGVADDGDLAAVDGGDPVGGLLIADPRGPLFWAGRVRGKLNNRHLAVATQVGGTASATARSG